jgi:hypothetical protein
VVASNGAGKSGLSPQASATPHAAPRLQSRFDPGASQVVLSWPEWAGGWSLLSATNLAAPVLWTAVTNLLRSSNGLVYVNVAIGGEAQSFFRLQSL